MENTNTKIKKKEDIKGKKIAFYLNMPSMSPTVELHASLIRDLLDRNNTVVVYIIDRSFKSPTENPFNRKSIYNFAQFRAEDALRGLDVKRKYINLDNVNSNVSNEVYKKLDLGVMSSYASAVKAQTKQELNKKWTKAYDNMLESACKLYNYFCEEILQEGYDFLFMFNGRFGDAKPALEAARDSGIGFGLNEVKKTINPVVFVNELIHSIEGNGRRAFDFYEKNPEEAKKMAQEFFSKKTKNENTGDPVYTIFQSRGELPQILVETSKKIIAIYPTTEDEYKFIGQEWDGYVPESQVDEIDELASSLKDEDYLLVVKMHPNQANSAEGTLKKYQILAEKHENLQVIPPLSKVDTYALMNISEIVVTFASTIGVEATYAGKKSILIGDTTWSNMDAAHKVYSGKEASELIKHGFEVKPKKNAVVWGYYLYKNKDNLPGYKLVSNGEYTVNGCKVGHSRWRRVLQLPAKLEIEVSKPGFKFGKIFFSRVKDVANNIIRGKWAVK